MHREPPREITSRSEEETREIGRAFGKTLSVGDVVSIDGELGAGKTQLIKGIAEARGVDPDSSVFSPTYSIANVYEGDLPIYHVDLYRLKNNWDDIAGAGVLDLIGGEGITLIEWGDRAKNYLPNGTVKINIIVLGGGERLIEISR